MSTQPISSPAQADELFSHLSDVMEALLRLIEEETELVRAGKLNEAANLEPVKTDMARLYLADVADLKTAIGYLKHHRPAPLDALRKRHDSFCALLQINLTVLVTAHAVAEGIVRGISDELNRKAAPQVDGASGRAHAPSPTAAQPMAMNRTL